MARHEEHDDNAPETIIGATVKIEGDLVSEGNIKVDGLVTGKIKTKRNLFVGPAARIEADVEAASAEVAGVINGNIKVADTLVMGETSQVTGDIACRRLSVAMGAYFSGSAQMPERKETAQKPSEKEEE